MNSTSPLAIAFYICLAILFFLGGYNINELRSNQPAVLYKSFGLVGGLVDFAACCVFVSGIVISGGLMLSGGKF